MMKRLLSIVAMFMVMPFFQVQAMHSRMTRLPHRTPSHPQKRPTFNARLNCIDSYRSMRDNVAVRRIASDNITRLSASGLSGLRGVMQAFECDRGRKKVYLVNDKPVGFIIYSVSPSRTNVLKQKIAPEAVIHALAIDKEFQRGGCGSALLKDAIVDWKKESVDRISLMTASERYHGYDLEDFYKKFGFECVDESGISGSRVYDLYLKKPDPMTHAIKKIGRRSYFFKMAGVYGLVVLPLFAFLNG